LVYIEEIQKNPIKNPWLKPSHEKQKGRPKKGHKNGEPTGTKEGRDIVPLAYIHDR
jgi:hypothetical protein